MKYLYKNASYEAANRVNYFRSLIKKADFNEFMSSLGEYKNPLIGAGLGLGLGYLLSPEDNKLLGTLGGGLAGGLAGWGYDNWFGEKNKDTSYSAEYTDAGDRSAAGTTNTPLKSHFNADLSYTWITPEGKEVVIPKDDMYRIGLISQDIYLSPDKYLYTPEPTDAKTPVKQFMLRDDINLEPEKRLVLIHGGSMNQRVPKDFNFPDEQTRERFKGNLPLYYVSKGLSKSMHYVLPGKPTPPYKYNIKLRQPMSYHFSPAVFTPDRYDALQEFLKRNGMTVWDIGNLHSDKWRKHWNEFNEIYRGAPIGFGS